MYKLGKEKQHGSIYRVYMKIPYPLFNNSLVSLLDLVEIIFRWANIYDKWNDCSVSIVKLV